MTAELETPALLVDLDRLESNLEAMAELCARHDRALRPHAKSHKTVEIALRQHDLGAVGITVAKLGEAEVFVDGGIDDVLVCYPLVGDDKLRRLVALARRATISTVVDDRAAAEALAAAASRAGVEIEALLKLDVGMHRVGVPEREADGLAAAVARMPGIRLRGVCIHEGEVYGEPDPSRRRALARERVGRLIEVAERLRGQGLPIERVSCGATPSAVDVADLDGLTEMRPGNYVFYDAIQVALGVVPPERCALSVLTTVVSHAAPERAITDAGAKTLTLDRGVHGLELVEGFGELGVAGAQLVGLSEEHGWLRLEQGCRLSVGDRLRVVPNHACPVVNNFGMLALTREGRHVGSWHVAARGRID